MRFGWKRYPIRVKLCCYLLGFLLLTLSALLVLGSLFNRSMDVVDKRLQDYYNITAFSEVFTSADHELEMIIRRGPELRQRLAEQQTGELLRRMGDLGFSGEETLAIMEGQVRGQRPRQE